MWKKLNCTSAAGQVVLAFVMQTLEFSCKARVASIVCKMMTVQSYVLLEGTDHFTGKGKSMANIWQKCFPQLLCICYSLRR